MATTAGAVATVAKPMGETQKRPKVAGLEPVEKVMTGKAKKKGPYQNSLSEAKKDFAAKIAGKIAKANKDKKETDERVKQHQQDQKKDKVDEAKLDEDDIILVPGQGMKRKTGFVPHGQSRVDHEVEMARSDVLATMKNAKAIYQLLKDRSEDEGIEGWVQEKLIKANDYLNAVKEYYDEKMMQEMTGGVIAAGGVGEGSLNEGQYEMMMRNGQVKKFMAKDDADAKRIAAGHGAKSVIRLKGGVPAGKVSEQGVAEGQLDEKAVSKAQQKFFGMAHAMQKGAKIKGASKELKDVAKSMGKGDVKDFAKTKHKGLPQHVTKKD